MQREVRFNLIICKASDTLNSINFSTKRYIEVYANVSVFHLCIVSSSSIVNIIILFVCLKKMQLENVW